MPPLPSTDPTPTIDFDIFSKCIKDPKTTATRAIDTETYCYSRSIPPRLEKKHGKDHASEIWKVIFKLHTSELQECYKSTLKSGFRDHGWVALIATVNFMKGEVSSLKIAPRGGAAIGPNLQKCLTEKINAWKFPKVPIGDKILIQYPVNFSEG